MSFKPSGPVAAFAFPAFINKAVFFFLSRFVKFLFATFTGAAGNLFEVNKPEILLFLGT